MVSNRLRILDLFSGTQSVKKAFPEADYIGIDIYEGDGNLILDLSVDNVVEKLKELLPKDWKPHFIWASPICTPFSRATGIVGGTLSYLVEDGNIRLRSHEEYNIIKHKQYIHLKDDEDFINKHIKRGEMGIKLFENTQKIIEYFNVPFVIENPAYAVSQYLPHLKTLEPNLTHYCEYGFNYRKATKIYSNKKLELKKCTHRKHSHVLSGGASTPENQAGPGSNKLRSRVPQPLIKDIVIQMLTDEGEGE